MYVLVDPWFGDTPGRAFAFGDALGDGDADGEGDGPLGMPWGYFARNCSRPSRPRRTAYGVPAYSAWYSKRARSKYWVGYCLPSVGFVSMKRSVSGKPCCARPPCAAQ